MGNRGNLSRGTLVGFVDIKMVDRNISYSGFIGRISRTERSALAYLTTILIILKNGIYARDLKSAATA
jgi:hypothetical protein